MALVKFSETSAAPIVEGAPWAFIAVMGVTGSGKSTFIRTVTGDNSVVVGNGLTSCTSDLKGYSFHTHGYNVNLVDSPGFNDTYRSETAVLQDIARWLRESYEEKTKLNGIIYLHGINHSRMEGSALRNLIMFRELCGPEPLKNVVLTTTFWGDVAADVGDLREQELRDTPAFWGDMLKRKSRMARFTDKASGINIVSDLLGSQPKPLKIQRELVEEDFSLIDTSAGRIVNEELVRLENKHREERTQMQRELAEARQQHDTELQEILSEQEARLEQQIERVQRQQEQLKADRRADRRRLQNEFEEQLWELRSKNSELQESLAGNEDDRRLEREAQDARIRSLERYNQQAEQKWDGLDIDQVIAKVRAEESKLQAEEREALEAEIKKLKEDGGDEPDKSDSRWKSWAKKTGKVFLMGLRVALPVATLFTLGVPISL